MKINLKKYISLTKCQYLLINRLRNDLKTRLKTQPYSFSLNLEKLSSAKFADLKIWKSIPYSTDHIEIRFSTRQFTSNIDWMLFLFPSLVHSPPSLSTIQSKLELGNAVSQKKKTVAYSSASRKYFSVQV